MQIYSCKYSPLKNVLFFIKIFLLKITWNKCKKNQHIWSTLGAWWSLSILAALTDHAATLFSYHRGHLTSKTFTVLHSIDTSLIFPFYLLISPNYSAGFFFTQSSLPFLSCHQTIIVTPSTKSTLLVSALPLLLRNAIYVLQII